MCCLVYFFRSWKIVRSRDCFFSLRLFIILAKESISISTDFYITSVIWMLPFCSIRPAGILKSNLQLELFEMYRFSDLFLSMFGLWCKQRICFLRIKISISTLCYRRIIIWLIIIVSPWHILVLFPCTTDLCDPNKVASMFPRFLVLLYQLPRYVHYWGKPETIRLYISSKVSKRPLLLLPSQETVSQDWVYTCSHESDVKLSANLRLHRSAYPEVYDILWHVLNQEKKNEKLKHTSDTIMIL